MMQHRPGPGLSIHVDSSAPPPTTETADCGGMLWFGDAGSESGPRTDPVQIIGSAHGPRLLELLRAS